LGAAAALAVLVALALVLLPQLLDPDRPARDLALRDTRAAVELKDGQVWRDYSPCFQRRTSMAEFIAEQNAGVQRHRAPVDTRYSVVAVTPDGVYRRVEVRIEAPGSQPVDIELDVRMYGGRWVLVDRGALGHVIFDDCAHGGGS
jgi:hypothetical protein